jgi:hypothetical protein
MLVSVVRVGLRFAPSRVRIDGNDCVCSNKRSACCVFVYCFYVLYESLSAGLALANSANVDVSFTD